jgi:NAD(P)H-quinone oxidoreductase subunit 5
MPAPFAELPLLHSLLLYAIPFLYLLSAVAPGSSGRTLEIGWWTARWAAGLAIVCAAASLVWFLIEGPGLTRGDVVVSFGDAGALRFGVRADALAVSVALLVSFIGWVIVAYSQRYMGGDPRQGRYIRGLMLTLAAVSVLVITNNLLVLALAWIATSVALHGLLTHFDERLPALMAAHKKFIASRVADVFLLGAIALIATTLGTLEIDEALQRAHALAEFEPALQWAAVLLVLAAILKCAQLPVHGWLIQVMEAPTPVSALLHAGVVNLGGFLLIRLAGLVSEVWIAQTLLVVVGSLTAAIAALVMMTRISIKVSLAWSTCAQMGFMLMQCGLGMYELALLHLIAHSLYKAHAFLGAGGAVEQARLDQMAPAERAIGAGRWAVSALLGVAMVLPAAAIWGVEFGSAPALWALAAILCLALAPLFAGRVLVAGVNWTLTVAAAAFAVALAYFGLHDLAKWWLASSGAAEVPLSGADGLQIGWVILVFAGLFALQSAIRAQPQGMLARCLYPYMFAGLYMDELFTRVTFFVWPVRAPAAPAGGQAALDALRTDGSAR